MDNNTLSTRRRKYKLTQSNLGQKVGVTRQAIASYESGERRPSPEVARKIASALGLTIDQMWAMFYSDNGKHAAG